ncbi:MAG: T9SS type A sorting domain-containing protein, partial [Chitinophagales bacterium]
TYAWEHAYVDWYMAPKGANFLFTNPSPCVDLTKSFQDFTNFINNPASASYFWDFDDGTNSFDQNPTHTFPTPGTYNVCLVATEGTVSYQQCKSVTVDYCTTNVDEITSLSNFSIYPNPANDVINLSLDFSTPENVVINILNAQGQIVFSEAHGAVSNYTSGLDISNYANGYYLIQITDGNRVSSKSFLISR